MHKVLLLLLLFLLNGCSMNSILALGEVDKVQIVKKNSSVSHYRAYFTRTNLKPINNGKKYIYFYNKKKKDLAILLYKYNTYTLYSLFHPNKKLFIHATSKTTYRQIKKALQSKGYSTTSPYKLNTTVKVAKRKFKGFKTLLVDIKKQHRLKQIQENPKAPSIKKETPTISKNPSIPFSYYTEKSSCSELTHYLSEEDTQNSLTFSQYNQLKKRLHLLKEVKLLREGSLEELIEAYKINKKPHYKKRILILMKEAQK